MIELIIINNYDLFLENEELNIFNFIPEYVKLANQRGENEAVDYIKNAIKKLQTPYQIDFKLKS